MLFFDDGGVLNDNQVRGKQWQKLIGEYFQPRYGGEKDNWTKANSFAVGIIIDFIDDIQKKKTKLSYKEYKEVEDRLWTEKMFEYLGIKAPPKDQYSKLIQEVNSWIMPQIRAAYPGVIDLVKGISLDFTCHTASNETSSTLNMYLSGMDIRTSFKYLFGPDLVNCMKSHEEYYLKILSYSGTAKEQAIVIDDNPIVLHNAASLGIEVIQSCLDNQQPEYENYFTNSTELKEILDEK